MDNKDYKAFDFNTFIYTILTTLLLGVLTHGYAYFNMLYSHDSMLVYQDDDSWMLSLGRFLMPVYEKVRGRYYPPSVVGVFALLFIAVSAYLIFKIFDVKNRVIMIMIIAVMSTNATVVLLTASFIHDLDAYMLALLFSVAGVYLWITYKYGYMVAIVFFVVSEGLYPAYIQISVGIFIVLTIRELILKWSLKKVIYDFISRMFGIAVSVGIYYISARVAAQKLGISFSQSSNSVGAVSRMNYISDLPKLIIELYRKFFANILNPHSANAAIKRMVFIGLLLIAVIFIVRYIVINKLPGINVFLVLILCLILPIGLNCIYIASGGFFHDLMRYPDYLIYVFSLIVIEKCLKPEIEVKKVDIWKRISLLLAVIIMIDNFIYAGNIYLHKDMAYQSTFFTMTRVIDRLEQTDGYYPGAPVAFVGDIEKTMLNYVRDDYFKMGGNGANFYTVVNYYKLYERYFQKLLGYPIYILPASEAYKIQSRPEVKNMSSFPLKDCIRNIDGVFVVRISETDLDAAQIFD
ncbi:MAG: glucosyltransferase domain-containing protein [Lachnospiraceae bacterium]|nr:glucosyltransferase domain-containing protein [Lachnospiraceae bacterium]